MGPSPALSSPRSRRLRGSLMRASARLSPALNVVVQAAQKAGQAFAARLW